MERLEIGRFTATSFKGELYEFIVYNDNSMDCPQMEIWGMNGIHTKPRPELWDSKNWNFLIRENYGHPDQTRLIKEFNIDDELFKYLNLNNMILYSTDMAYLYNFIDKDGFDKKERKHYGKRKGRAFKHASKKGEILTKWKNGEFN